MNYDKIQQVNKELKKFPTVTEKLDFWKRNYLDKFPGDLLGEYFEFKPDNSYEINDVYYGPLRLPANRILQVPELDFPKAELPNPKQIEYYRWLLYYLAEERFIKYTKAEILQQLSTPMGKEKLSGRKNRIIQIQKNAKALLAEGKISIIFKTNPAKEELFLWYTDELYARTVIPVTDINDDVVKSVCEHIYVFPFLKDLLKQNQILFIRIDVSKEYCFDCLINELFERDYFEENEIESLRKWFNGSNPSSPILIKEHMNHFASVIAYLEKRR